MNSPTSLIKNNRGQIAIFIALVFQVLFLFFAMIINVGLLVHHKINLQNSVDIAAYYGAMKQAENLNVIAHINYQIRQSYKLLVWRYRTIGTAGDFYTHPYNKPNKFLPAVLPDEPVTTHAISCPGGSAGNDAADIKQFNDTPPFCINYRPFKPNPANENNCRQQSCVNFALKTFSVPPILPILSGITSALANAAQAALTSIASRCKSLGVNNFFQLSNFFASYRIDQKNRMTLISKISRNMSSGNDFVDMDNKQVSEGIIKTLRKNLTAPNHSGLKIRVYNSLSSDSCGIGGSTDTNTLPKWLSKIKSWPNLFYSDALVCNPNDPDETVKLGIKNLAPGEQPYFATINDPEVLPTINSDGYKTLTTALALPGGDPEDLFYPSIGVEKNPWCMAYMGVYAESEPNIPFSPFGSVKLKAKGFAKPFGGKIGPWYGSYWAAGASHSDGALIDKNLPARYYGADLSPVVANVGYAANYSRFVGDPYGLKSRMVLGQYGRAIYELDPSWKNPALPEGSSPNYNHWSNIVDFSTPDAVDLLSWDRSPSIGPLGKESDMRWLEMSAVMPDLFDITYYSIEPDFYNNYYGRLKTYCGNDTVCLSALYPDIGYHQGAPGFDSFSVKDQIRYVQSKNQPPSSTTIDLQNQLTYIINDATKWTHLLTSWTMDINNALDFSAEAVSAKIGRCAQRAKGMNADGTTDATLIPTTGNCVEGGRTGYSVKLVSENFLSSKDLSLGGTLSGQGALLNSPAAISDWLGL